MEKRGCCTFSTFRFDESLSAICNSSMTKLRQDPKGDGWGLRNTTVYVTCFQVWRNSKICWHFDLLRRISWRPCWLLATTSHPRSGPTSLLWSDWGNHQQRLPFEYFHVCRSFKRLAMYVAQFYYWNTNQYVTGWMDSGAGTFGGKWSWWGWRSLHKVSQLYHNMTPFCTVNDWKCGLGPWHLGCILLKMSFLSFFVRKHL